MHVTRIIALAAIAIVFMGSDLGISDAFGQAKNERLFGNGRFLRRVFGQEPENDKANAAAKEKAQAKPKSKGKEPTLATPNRDAVLKPSKQFEPTLATPPSRLNAGTSNSFTPRLKQQPEIGTTRSGERGPAEVTRSSREATIGFGMFVESKGDALVVSKLDPKGNAKEAGVKNGDVLVRGGGVDFQSVEEFNQISEILKDGDQLEFEVRRRGKDEKVLITFGTPVDESTLAPEKPSVLATPVRDTQTGSNGVNTKNNYSFLPTNRESTRRQPSSIDPIATEGNLRSVLGNDIKIPESRLPKPTNAQQPDTNQWRSAESIAQEKLRRQLEQQKQEIERLRQLLENRKEEGSTFQIPELGGPALSGPQGG